MNKEKRETHRIRGGPPFFWCEQAYKPGSVLTAIYLDLTLPPSSSYLLGNGRAGHVFLARDADPRLTGPLEDCCREAGVPVAGGHTMAQLGRACGIDVPTAAAALLAKEKPLPTE